MGPKKGKGKAVINDETIRKKWTNPNDKSGTSKLPHAVVLDHQGQPTIGPDISSCPIPQNFSVLDLDLKNPSELLQNMKDCIANHRFWTYVHTDKRYKSPSGAISWKCPRAGTYQQYIKHNGKYLCLVGIASQSWLKGIVIKDKVGEFPDSGKKSGTYIETGLPKITFKFSDNYCPNVQRTKLGPRWLAEAFDAFYSYLTDARNVVCNLKEAFTRFVVHFWDTVRNDDVKDLVLESFNPVVIATHVTHWLGNGPVGLMQKWKRCCGRATQAIEEKISYVSMPLTSPATATELLGVVRVVYRSDQDCTPFNTNSMKINLNDVDDPGHGNNDSDNEGQDNTGSRPDTPKYPDWILDSCLEQNGEQQHGADRQDNAGEHSQMTHCQQSAGDSKAHYVITTTAKNNVEVCSRRKSDLIMDLHCLSGFLTEGKAENVNLKRTERSHPLPFLGIVKEEELSGDELEEFIKGHYSSRVKHTPFDGSTNVQDDEFTVSGLLKESVIWRIKCMVGHERQIAFCLMQKYVDLQKFGTKVQIISAFALDNVRGFVFVEAEKACDVSEACKGFCSVYISRINSVPVAEVPSLLSSHAKPFAISPGTWVRMTTGIYKGDLAQVVSADEGRKRVMIKLIPRVDLWAISKKIDGAIPLKEAAIPTPRLISSQELEFFGPHIERKHDRQTNDFYEVLDGLVFEDGFLYKRAALNSLIYWGIQPTETELLKFSSSPTNTSSTDDLDWVSSMYGPKKRNVPKEQDMEPSSSKGQYSKASTATEDSEDKGFNLHDLVLFGRKDFGPRYCITRDNSSGVPSGPFGTEADKPSWGNGLPSFGSDSWQRFSSFALPVQNAGQEQRSDAWGTRAEGNYGSTGGKWENASSGEERQSHRWEVGGWNSSSKGGW